MDDTEKKEPSKKDTAIGCLALIVIATALIFLLKGCFGGDDTKTVTIDWHASEIAVENVKASLAGNYGFKPSSIDIGFPGDISKVDIIDNAANPGMKNIQIYYQPASYWDETDFVKDAGGTAIYAGSVLFANPKVEEIVMYAQTEMVDQYGKTNLDNGVKIVIDRELAAKSNWQGLAQRHTSDPGNIYRICGNYSIHPGLLKNVKTEEVKLR